MAWLSSSSAERTAFSTSRSCGGTRPAALSSARPSPPDLILATAPPTVRWTRSFYDDSLGGGDPHLQVGHHVLVQAHRDAVLADLLDRLLELDLPAVELDPLGLDQVGDLGRRHRAEELALLADVRLHLEPQRLEPALLDPERLQLARHPLGHHALLVLDLAHVALGGERRLPLRDEVVVRVPGLDAHHLARLAQARDRLAQDHLAAVHGDRPRSPGRPAGAGPGAGRA